VHSIVGGKLTTHRALAEDVLRKLRNELPRPVASNLTHQRPLPGALPQGERDELLSDLRGRFGERQARRLWGVYGRFAGDIAALAARPELAMTLDGGEVLAAELVHAFESEWARTLEDVLQRRCMAGLRADFGLRTASAAASVLERLGVFDKSRAAGELAQYRELAARHGAVANGD
jgi:glycerol-3-phosphate dehydrogenase